jgi:linoleoyl-CoA desaturase
MLPKDPHWAFLYLSATEGSFVTTTRVTFANRDATEFVAELKRRVAHYFEQAGISSKANGAMVFKTVVILGITFGAYGLILSRQFSPLEMLGLAVVMGIGFAGIGFSISHDALHGAYSSNPRVNRLIGFSFDLMGANGYMWKITHNVIHHTYTNIHGIDEDLTVSPLLRLSPRAPRRAIHRWQHLYAFLTYSFSTFFWVFVKDYKYFLQKDLGPYQGRQHPRSEIAILIGTKLLHYTWTLAIPFVVLGLPLWQFAIGFLAMHLTAGLILGIVFQLAHVVEGTDHPVPDAAGDMENAWTVHEMETTSNFGRGNRLLCWYVGGLNFQIEHHLFPKVCSIHYPAISPIVQQTAEEYGITYNQHRTLRDAIRSHYVTLRKFGRSDPLPAAAARESAAAAAPLAV